MTSQPRLRAVLWDMDGTIVDTEPLWIAAETQLVADHGGAWTHEHAMSCVGLGLLDAAEIMRGAGVSLAPEQIVAHLSQRVMSKLTPDEAVFRPGARELLLANRDAGIVNVLVTMSYREMALQVAELLPEGTFTAVIAGDDVARPKPHPDPYLQALAAVDVDVDAALAIEDSPNGLRSAIASGVATVGVPHALALDGIGAHVIWPTLSGRTTDDLRSVHQEANS